MADGGYGAGYSAGYSDGANSVGGGEGYGSPSRMTPEKYRAHKRKRRGQDALLLLFYLAIIGVVVGVLWVLFS